MKLINYMELLELFRYCDMWKDERPEETTAEQFLYWLEDFYREARKQLDKQEEK